MKLLISLLITNSLFLTSCTTTSNNSKSAEVSKETINESNPGGIDTSRSYLSDQDEKQTSVPIAQPKKKSLKSK